MSRTERAPLSMEHALLGLLRKTPMHGYELYQHVTAPDALWLVWRMKQSQLYALLARLEREGYIRATLQPQESRPPRKVFRLTRAGRERFRVWAGAPVAHGRALRQEFLAKLYFALQDGPQAVSDLISHQRNACMVWLGDMPPVSVSPATFPRLVHSFRDSQIRAMLDWLNDTERELAGGRRGTDIKAVA